MSIVAETSNAGKHTGIALLVILVVYPLLYCSGIMGVIIEPIFTRASRLHWWLFWLVNLGFHIIPFLVVRRTLSRNHESWMSLGLDWNWFLSKRTWFVVLLLLLIACAVFVPQAYYGDNPPRISNTIFIAPITVWERLFVIFAAAVVGVTEEVLFRGFAITRLNQLTHSVWLSVLIAGVAFIFIHGTPKSWGGGLQYFVAALAFSVPFVLLKYKRLEWLITIHFLIDVSLVLAP
ncbi:MAG: CPBP family intramembrane metalloprotease [Cyclobacteriaceae bacterium]|nr:CPBP family intramembrane metalloprotease [Cyclobacteriaceae bacterium]